MSKLRGMLTLEDLTAKVEAEEIETVILAFPDHYGRLMGKRLDAEFFLNEAARQGTHACNYLLTVDMEMEPVAGLSLRQLGIGLRRFSPGARYENFARRELAG